MCVGDRKRALIPGTSLSLLCFEYHLPPFSLPLPPSSPLFLLSPSCCLFPVTGEVAGPGDPWPLDGHLGRYVGRWGLCWRAARTLRKPVLIRWRRKTEEEEVIVTSDGGGKWLGYFPTYMSRVTIKANHKSKQMLCRGQNPQVTFTFSPHKNRFYIFFSVF